MYWLLDEIVLHCKKHRIIWFLYRLERLVEQDCEVGGISLKKGTYVSAMIYGMHHDAEIWPDPETFDPDRYIVQAFNYYQLILCCVGAPSPNRLDLFAQCYQSPLLIFPLRK